MTNRGAINEDTNWTAYKNLYSTYLHLLPNIASHFYQLNLINPYTLNAVKKYYAELTNLRTEYYIGFKSRKNKQKLLFGIQNCKSVPVRSRSYGNRVDP